MAHLMLCMVLVAKYYIPKRAVKQVYIYRIGDIYIDKVRMCGLL